MHRLAPISFTPSNCIGTQIPTFGFLYVAGWIGYVGRDYLIRVKKEKKPTDKEIIIDVPLALKVALGGVGWPAKALGELRNGTLLVCLPPFTGLYL